MNNSIEDYITITNNGLDIDANNVNANCITSKQNTFNMDTNGNLVCNSITTNIPIGVNFDQIYPVGSIYLSVSNTNPGTLFGGTWQKIEGKFLLGADNTYSVGSTGGEASHTLSVNEMPNHTHSPSSYGNSWVPGTQNISRTEVATSNYSNKYIPTPDIGADGWVWGATGSTGGSQAHNNMPPYLAVNIWQRTS